MTEKRVCVGLSGGVDSAVSALLLKQAGYAVEAVFMKNWEEDDADDHCSAAEDYAAARAVAAHLGVPLRAVNFATEYWDRVFAHFLAEHRAGRTPNPDVLCNKEIKFRAFLDYALAGGADYIATGHYARLAMRDGRPRLLKGRDGNKDQSYFLYALQARQLERVLFPIGDLTKPEVRRLARDAGLPNYDRRDSTGICFIGERDHREFLARYLKPEPGDMRTLSGTLKGHHNGLAFYTIGQRHGLGIGGAGEPWYVVAKDAATRTLYIEQGEHPALYSDALIAGDLSWVNDAPPADRALSAKTRYRQSDQACELSWIDAQSLRIRFAQPQRAVTPGQAVVLYAGDECLGGGTIKEALTKPVHGALSKTLGQSVASASLHFSNTTMFEK